MITAISRDWGADPCIVRIVTTDNLGAITTAGYLTAQADEIAALNNGNFEWTPTDYILISYNGGIGFFTRDSTTMTFVAGAVVPGSLANTLPDGELFVGSAANVATAVAMTGDVAIDNAGVTAIQAGAVESSMVAPSLLQYIMVPMSAAEFLGMYAAPKLLIPAAGANTLIRVHLATLELDYGGVQFAAGGPVVLQYTPTVNGLGPQTSVTVAAAIINGRTADSAIGINTAGPFADAADVVNQGVYLSNQTAAFTTGNSTVDVHVWYSVTPTSF